MSARVNDTELQSAVEEYLTNSPITANVRHSNPNLQPLEGEDAITPVEPRTKLTRKRPSLPLPELLSTTSLDTSTSLNTSTSSRTSTSQFFQAFWKFHLIKFGNHMYLTTNPTPRHLHCRSFPGYFILIDGNALDYTMSFEDIETGASYLRIRKRTSREGEFFRYKVRRARGIQNGRISEIDNPEVHENFLRRELIPESLFPSPPDVPMVSYHTEDFNGTSWSVGAIPRARESRVSAGESKYIHKHNVYFHNTFELTYPINSIPPVRAVFRPSEASARKRMMRSLNRLLKFDSGKRKFKPDDMDSSMFSEVKSYYKAGDGLYGDHTPADDEPDKHSKCGWLTVYEDEQLFLEAGMFDMVVGLSVCVAYEKMIG
ncbi:CIC11C00000000449 [Sungouiella intermedia]|uniref:CIC11C00000000449 n=1 Tax=Sungouiella intermedia TaxID=45354 RepID=A0A1L0G2A1_9ASCO|nr:CIC11C00000000449 [[Candida] intermedia]